MGSSPTSSGPYGSTLRIESRTSGGSSPVLPVGPSGVVRTPFHTHVTVGSRTMNHPGVIYPQGREKVVPPQAPCLG